MALTKEQKAAIKEQNLAELTQLKQLKQAQDAEITALKSTLASQGLTQKEINSLVKAEKKLNSTEYSTAKTTLKADGLQYIAGSADAQILSGAGTYAGNETYLNGVNSLLGQANDLYKTYGIQQTKQIAGDGTYTGISLDQLTKAVLNRNEDGTFNRGTGSTKLYGATYNLLNDASKNYGQTLSADSLGKVKLVGQDANGNDIYRSTLTSGDASAYSLLTKNEDGSYTNIGYTGLKVPPPDDGGFFGSTLGKIALGVGAFFTGGALMPALTGTLGTIGAGAATGGLLGAGTAALTGGDLLKGALLGGVTGGAISAAAPYVSDALSGLQTPESVTVAPSTTTSTLGNLNLPNVGDLTSGTGLVGQGLNPNIITSAGQLNDLQAAGLISPQAAAAGKNFLLSGAVITPQAAINLGINPAVLQPTTVSGLSPRDVATASDFGLSSSTVAPMGDGSFQTSVLETARQVNDAQTALGDLYSGNTADKLLAQSQPYSPSILDSGVLKNALNLYRGFNLANSLFNRPQQLAPQQMQQAGMVTPYGEVDYSGLFNLLGSQSRNLKKQQSLLG